MVHGNGSCLLHITNVTIAAGGYGMVAECVIVSMTLHARTMRTLWTLWCSLRLTTVQGILTCTVAMCIYHKMYLLHLQIRHAKKLMLLSGMWFCRIQSAQDRYRILTSGSRRSTSKCLPSNKVHLPFFTVWSCRDHRMRYEMDS